MKHVFAAFLLLSACCFAQSKDFTASTALDATVANGVAVNFTYSLPADEPALKAMVTDPAQAPAHIAWHWGDEGPGAKRRNFSEAAHADVNKATHTYKPGTYGVMVTVTDTKGRFVRQDSITIKVSAPVEILNPGSPCLAAH
jgi:PKD repeat protein